MMKKMILLMSCLIYLNCLAPSSGGLIVFIEMPMFEKDKILLAHQVKESRCKADAHNIPEDAVGIMQIRPIAVREVNRILKKYGSTNKFTLKDRWDSTKSVQMWYIIQNEHNPKYNLTIASRVWNSGTTKPLKSTIVYVKDVKRIYLRL